jgi:hypothetical protein
MQSKEKEILQSNENIETLHAKQIEKRIAKSLIKEMSEEEKEEFSKLPFIDLQDLEDLHYL